MLCCEDLFSVLLLQFRVKELKEVLTSVGLPKGGNKKDHVERILQYIRDGSPCEQQSIPLLKAQRSRIPSP